MQPVVATYNLQGTVQPAETIKIPSSTQHNKSWADLNHRGLRYIWDQQRHEKITSKDTVDTHNNYSDDNRISPLTLIRRMRKLKISDIIISKLINNPSICL